MAVQKTMEELGIPKSCQTITLTPEKPWYPDCFWNIEGIAGRGGPNCGKPEICSSSKWCPYVTKTFLPAQSFAKKTGPGDTAVGCYDNTRNGTVVNPSGKGTTYWCLYVDSTGKNRYSLLTATAGNDPDAGGAKYYTNWEYGSWKVDPLSPNMDCDVDGIKDNVDNCLQVKNPAQRDLNKNGVGCACDSTETCPVCPGSATDCDADGVPDAIDNCLSKANPDQKNTDGDALGCACDPDESCTENVECPDPNNPPALDPDCDRIANNYDNCPNVYNPKRLNVKSGIMEQEDNDQDKIGCVCEKDLSDLCELVSNCLSGFRCSNSGTVQSTIDDGTPWTLPPIILPTP